MRFEYRSKNKSPISGIFGLIILALVLVGLFMLARFVFRILAFLAPVLIIVALILDYKTVIGYGKWLVNLVKQTPLMGILAIVLTVLGFPLVSAFLAGKAYLSRNVKQAEKEQEPQREGEYIDFEEVDEQPLELPELSKIKKEEERKRPSEPKTKPKEDDKYDSLFD